MWDSDNFIVSAFPRSVSYVLLKTIESKRRVACQEFALINSESSRLLQLFLQRKLSSLRQIRAIVARFPGDMEIYGCKVVNIEFMGSTGSSRISCTQYGKQ